MEFLSTTATSAHLNEQLGALRSICDGLHLSPASEPLSAVVAAAAEHHQHRRKLMFSVVAAEARPFGGNHHKYTGALLATKVGAEECLAETVVSSEEILRRNNWARNAAFGAEMKRKHFNLIPRLIFLNTGSYGACPHFTLQGRADWEALEMADPCAWDSHIAPFQLRAVTNRLAHFVNAHPGDVLLMPNCNTCTSTVFKSLPWECGDIILLLNVEYDATLLAAKYLTDAFGVQVLVVDIQLPSTDDDIVNAVDSFLRTRKRSGAALPIFANFCHVTSKTAWVFPVKRLTQVCHSFGITVMVDGAQAPGHVKVDVADIGAEYYCGTCHKWMFSCQGVAFLAVTPSKQPHLQPLAPREPYGSSFEASFSRAFAEDLTTFLALHQAFDFVEMVCGGWNRVMQYQRRLAHQAVAELEQMWELASEGLYCIQRSQMHDLETNESFNCLPLVPLPKSRNATQREATTLIGYLLTKYNITAFILVERFAFADGEPVDVMVVRLSCAIHVSLEDVRHLGRAVKDLAGRYRATDVVKDFLPDAIQSMIS